MYSSTATLRNAMYVFWAFETAKNRVPLDLEDNKTILDGNNWNRIRLPGMSVCVKIAMHAGL